MSFAKENPWRTPPRGKTWALLLLLWPVWQAALWLLLLLLAIASILILMPYKRLLAVLLALCFFCNQGCTLQPQTKSACLPDVRIPEAYRMVPTALEPTPPLYPSLFSVPAIQMLIECDF